MSTAILLILLTLAITLQLLDQIWDRKTRRLPPGPYQLPLIGNLWQIHRADSKYPYKALHSLSKTYGDVMTTKLGAVNAVTINGFESIKNALTCEDFLNRFDPDWFLHRSVGKKIGILASSNELWRSTRRFTVHQLRDFGFGRKHFLQNLLDTEIEELSRRLDLAIDQEGGIVDPHDLFGIPSINLVWVSVAGARFDHGDPKITKLANMMDAYASSCKVSGGAAIAFPFLIKWLPDFLSITKLYAIDDEIHHFLKDLVNEIRQRGTYKTEPGSFIEGFLQRMETHTSSDLVEREVFKEEVLISCLYDLFFTGIDTVSATMTFCLMWLVMYPEVQEKVKQELQTVIGHSRSPTLEDKATLPYARATVLEMHRRGHVVPTVPKKVYVDATLDKYIIPRGTLVLVNMYSILMDETFWGDPQNFRPSRFLDEKNNIINAERVLNFGTGKRNCLAENIADSTIFAMLTQLVQKYEFLPVEHGQVPVSDPIMGGVLTPPPFNIRVQRRKQF